MNRLNVQDTICAIATAPGGAIGIIRLSGPDSIRITDNIFTPIGKDKSPLKDRKDYTLIFGQLSGRRSISQPIPFATLIHRRGSCGNIMSRLCLYLATSNATSHKERMSFGRTRRVYPTRFFERENGLKPSRSCG